MRKKSGKKAARGFNAGVREIDQFLRAIEQTTLTDAQKSWSFDYAVIRLYREFEDLVLNCLIAAINGSTAHLSLKTGISFPKHLTDEVCEYLVIRDGYFDFRGREGLIGTLKRFLSDDHYLISVVKKSAYKEALERLCALRNFAAHDSKVSKRRALDAIGATRLSASGAWLKKQKRFYRLSATLAHLADEIEQQAPH